MNLSFSLVELGMLLTAMASAVSVSVRLKSVEKKLEERKAECELKHVALEKVNCEQWNLIRQTQIDHASCCGHYREGLARAPTV